MNHRMIPAILTMLVLPLTATAQIFEEAMQHYEEQRYEEALQLLDELVDEEDEALLLRGRTHLALGNYYLASIDLTRSIDSSSEEIVAEAQYSLSIKKFRTGNIHGALETLQALRSSVSRTGLNREADTLYSDLLAWVTDRQRMDIFWQTDSFDIRIDLIRSAHEKQATGIASSMLRLIEDGLVPDDRISQLERLRQQIEWSLPADQLRTYPTPDGTVYHIGVALPSGDPDDPGASVARNLYSGLIIAAEEFNARNSDRKVLLRFASTEAQPDSTRNIFHELIWKEQADVIVGPLFSENASVASQLAEEYEIPVITPLANSDEINPGNHYLFQLNPTFSRHGREMARYAVQELGLDTLAIISQQNSLGSSSATAFRSEAESLGAYVAYVIEDDFSRTSYELSEFTEVFNPDPEVADSLDLKPVDGIYAPFTGQEAETLINQLLTDLEWMESRSVVMGSEEWSSIRLTDEQQRAFPILHSRSFFESGDRERITDFREAFTSRFAREPDEFAHIGYDTGRFLFDSLVEAGNPRRLNRTIRRASLYRGLTMDIHFAGEQINRQVQIVPANERARELLPQFPDSR